MLRALSACVLDFRFACRSLRRQPGFAAVVVLTMAVGIGANVSIFGYLSYFLWPTIEAAERDRVVKLEGDSVEGRSGISYPDFRDLQRAWSTGADGESGLVRQLAGYRLMGLSIQGEGGSHYTYAHAVTGDYFALMGASPRLGRLLGPDDDRTAAPRVVVVHDFLWRRHFASDPEIVGKTVRLDDSHDYTVVGVTRPGFQAEGLGTGLYLPLGSAPWLYQLEDRGDPRLYVWARLAPSVTRARLQAAAERMSENLDADFPLAWARRFQVRSVDQTGMTPAEDPMVGGAFLLMVVVALLLLLACANVGSLMLARTQARARELAVHAALGAGRSRLGRRLLAESLLLSILGGLVGLVLADRALRVLEVYMLHSNPVTLGDWGDGSSLSFDPQRMTLFFVAAVVLSGLLFGMAPLAQLWRQDLVASLKKDSAGGTEGRLGSRRLLLVAQVALSVVVLTTAGLLVRSLWQVRAVELGFELGSQTLVSLYQAPASRRGGRPDPVHDAHNLELYHRFADEVRSLPGVCAAGFAQRAPLTWTLGAQAADVGAAERRDIGYNIVSDGYFRALSLPLLQGRVFDHRDRQPGTRVVVVSQALAEALWPPSSARSSAPSSVVGRQLRVFEAAGDLDGEVYEVVGVVGNLQQSRPSEPQPPMLFYPFDQHFHTRLSLIVDGGPAIAPTLHRLLRSAYPELALVNLQPLAEQARRAIQDQRMNSDFALGFGLLGLCLAALGIFSTFSYEVARRKREFGIRMAIGADAARIRRRVLTETGRLVTVGLGLGLAVSLAAARLLETLLFGVASRDPWTFAAVPLVLAAVAWLAALPPAVRASRLDPLLALKAE